MRIVRVVHLHTHLSVKRFQLGLFRDDPNDSGGVHLSVVWQEAVLLCARLPFRRVAAIDGVLLEEEDWNE